MRHRRRSVTCVLGVTRGGFKRPRFHIALSGRDFISRLLYKALLILERPFSGCSSVVSLLEILGSTQTFSPPTKEGELDGGAKNNVVSLLFQLTFNGPAQPIYCMSTLASTIVTRYIDALGCKES